MLLSKLVLNKLLICTTAIFLSVLKTTFVTDLAVIRAAGKKVSLFIERDLVDLSRVLEEN